MKRMRLIMLLLLLFSVKAKAQVVNIEGERMHTDSVRLAGYVNFSLSFSENNDVRLLILRNAAAIQAKSKNYRHLLLLLSNYDLSRSGEEEFSNAWFVHLRYNYTINKWLRWELFTQEQYNRLLGIRERYLAGTGPRFKLFQQRQSGYAGLSYMYEQEKTTAEPMVTNRQHRLSSYLTFTFDLKKIRTFIVTTTYFQPLIENFDDHRISNQSSLSFSLSNKLKFITSFSFLLDTAPPEGFNGRSLRFDQGLKYEF